MEVGNVYFIAPTAGDLCVSVILLSLSWKVRKSRKQFMWDGQTRMSVDLDRRFQAVGCLATGAGVILLRNFWVWTITRNFRSKTTIRRQVLGITHSGNERNLSPIVQSYCGFSHSRRTAFVSARTVWLHSWLLSHIRRGCGRLATNA